MKHVKGKHFDLETWAYQWHWKINYSLILPPPD